MSIAGQQWKFNNYVVLPESGNISISASSGNLFQVYGNATNYLKFVISPQDIKFYTTSSAYTTVCTIDTGSDVFNNAKSVTGRIFNEYGTFVTNTNGMYVVQGTSLTPGKKYVLRGNALSNGTFNIRANFFNAIVYQNNTESGFSSNNFLGRTGENTTNELIFTVPENTRQTIFTLYKDAVSSGGITLLPYQQTWTNDSNMNVVFITNDLSISGSSDTAATWVKKNMKRVRGSDETYLISETDITALADAIRNKTGNDYSLDFPDDFISAINSL